VPHYWDPAIKYGLVAALTTIKIARNMAQRNREKIDDAAEFERNSCYMMKCKIRAFVFIAVALVAACSAYTDYLRTARMDEEAKP
jgi:hypothetical protein